MNHHPSKQSPRSSLLARGFALSVALTVLVPLGACSSKASSINIDEPVSVDASEATRSAVGVKVWGLTTENEKVIVFGYDADAKRRYTVKMVPSQGADVRMFDMEVSGEASGRSTIAMAPTESADVFQFEASDGQIDESAKRVLMALTDDLLAAERKGKGGLTEGTGGPFARPRVALIKKDAGRPLTTGEGGTLVKAVECLITKCQTQLFAASSSCGRLIASARPIAGKGTCLLGPKGKTTSKNGTKKCPQVLDEGGEGEQGQDEQGIPDVPEIPEPQIPEVPDPFGDGGPELDSEDDSDEYKPGKRPVPSQDVKSCFKNIGALATCKEQKGC